MGLMLWKWFKYSGCINLYKIVGYIKAYKRYKKEDGNYNTAWIKRELVCQHKYNDKEGGYKCPLLLEVLVEPFLKEY